MAEVPSLSLLGMSETLCQHTLYVGDLHPETTVADLEATFSVIGPLDSFGIRKDAESGKSLCYAFVNFFNISHVSCKVVEEENGKSKCFGYVQFETHNSAISAITSLHGAVFQGKKLYVSIFKKKEERVMDALKEQNFTKSVWNSRGFGFVNFDSDEDARKAFEALNGQLIGSKKLFVGRALKKAEREMLLRMNDTHEEMS
ncbi:PREDICTED: polyadenylate-binding protein 6-like [Ipomoea nil]|uniref:polyadenylate-binding protein 6-like n=1 Tax=Ipomoea nil TaxID=35883 RepID=UPI000901F921|nr:PREDICTED: polyadenylate-binding protein 6-like [Ipomoea nil]